METQYYFFLRDRRHTIYFHLISIFFRRILSTAIIHHTSLRHRIHYFGLRSREIHGVQRQRPSGKLRVQYIIRNVCSSCHLSLSVLLFVDVQTISGCCVSLVVTIITPKRIQRRRMLISANYRRGGTLTTILTVAISVIVCGTS